GQNLTINSVTFGVQQATVDGINIDVVLWVDSDGCPPVQPGVDAAVLASQSLVVNMADEGSMITVEFPAGPVVPAGHDFIVEIVSVDDGTVPPFFSFRAMSNPNGQCGPSYIRTPDGSCGLDGWEDLAEVGMGFPDAHLIQVISATVGGTPSGACCMGDESCQFLNEAACNAAGGTYQGDGTGCAGGICDIIPDACGPGAGSCQEPNPTPGCDDEDCCAGVCDINPACCSLQWDALCVQIASKLLECLPEPGTCEAPFDTTITQNVDAADVSVGGVACAGGGVTTENSWARSYDLSLDIPGQEFTINCVAFGAESSDSAIDLLGTITIYEDTNGGEPGSPGDDLVELGTTEFTLAANTEGTLFSAPFDPPVVAPADSTIVVVMDLPNLQDLGGNGFAVYSGNSAGESGCTYLLSLSCGIATYTCAGDLGPFEDLHWLQILRGNVGGGQPCPWDLNGSGDVGILDLLALLAAWGPNPGHPADFDNSGTVGILDLLTLLANWGACP
ncbi:MAG: hypothetical protein IH988_10610, partial [Planctomycetes bacterium]|nr:hypothetical protein [Planctomycetota bacterium]